MRHLQSIMDVNMAIATLEAVGGRPRCNEWRGGTSDDRCERWCCVLLAVRRRWRWRAPTGRWPRSRQKNGEVDKLLRQKVEKGSPAETKQKDDIKQLAGGAARLRRAGQAVARRPLGQADAGAADRVRLDAARAHRAQLRQAAALEPRLPGAVQERGGRRRRRDGDDDGQGQVGRARPPTPRSSTRCARAPRRLARVGRHHRRGQPGAQLQDAVQQDHHRAVVRRAHQEDEVEAGGRRERTLQRAPRADRRWRRLAGRRLHRDALVGAALPHSADAVGDGRRAGRRAPPSTAAPTPFPVVVDTGTILTTYDDGSGATRAPTGDLTLFGVDGSGATSRGCTFTDVQLFEGPLGSLGVGAQRDQGRRRPRRRQPVALRRRPRLSRRGADDDAAENLHAVQLRAAADLRAAGRCFAVLPFSLAGGQDTRCRARRASSSATTSTPIRRRACSSTPASSRCPIRWRRCRACSTGSHLPGRRPRVPCRRASTSQLVVATGFPGLALSANAYDRLRGAGAAAALLSGPTDDAAPASIPPTRAPTAPACRRRRRRSGRAPTADERRALRRWRWCRTSSTSARARRWRAAGASAARTRAPARPTTTSRRADDQCCSGEQCCMLDGHSACLGAGSEYVALPHGDQRRHALQRRLARHAVAGGGGAEDAARRSTCMPDVTPLLVGHQRRRAADGGDRRRRHRHRAAGAAGVDHRLSGQPPHRAVRARRRLRGLSAAVAARRRRTTAASARGRSMSRPRAPDLPGCAHVHRPRELPQRFLLGANYWSRAGGPRMWERFDEADVRAELAHAARDRARLPAHVRLRADVDADAAGARRGGAGAMARFADAGARGRARRSCRRRWSGTCRARTSTSPARRADALALPRSRAARLAGGAGARGRGAALAGKPNVARLDPVQRDAAVGRRRRRDGATIADAWAHAARSPPCATPTPRGPSAPATA